MGTLDAGESSGRLPEAMAAKFVWQLLDAIEYCHDIGIIHRDLKPENIFLDSSSKKPAEVNIKVGDFGTARLVGSAGRAHTRAGTPQYLAPEIETDTKSGYGKECDLWSIGCTAPLVSAPCIDVCNQSILLGAIGSVEAVGQSAVVFVVTHV